MSDRVDTTLAGNAGSGRLKLDWIWPRPYLRVRKTGK
jgi:hypothetical protein